MDSQNHLDKEEAPLPAPNSSNKVNVDGSGLVTIKDPGYDKQNVGMTADTVTAMVELHAASSAVAREGLDLVGVLDVSGSMKDGNKLESMKKAMQFVIMKLTPLDRLSIVTFNGAATTRCHLRSMKPAAQSALKAIVEGLHYGGGTNIKAAMEAGLAVLASRVHTKGRSANIFLLSDGQDDEKPGARDVDPGLVSVYTFGFGKDAGHELLSDIAKRSHGGTFSSVPDGGNVSVPFSQLLAGLLTVVAQDVELTLRPKRDEPRDLEDMLVAAGTDYTQSTDKNTGIITIRLGTLFSGEVRLINVDMMLLAARPDNDMEEYDAELAEARVTYTAQGSSTHLVRRTLTIERSPEPAAEDEPSRKVLVVRAEKVRRNHAKSISTARALADAHDLKAAKEELYQAQDAVEDITLDDGEKMLGMLRAELQQLLDFMETQALFKEQGNPYALASVTSHGRQRYAARGGDKDDDVRLFATPRMEKYLEQAKKFEEDDKVVLPSADEDVKQETAENPIAAVSAPIAFYLKVAIEALQAIEKIVK